MRRLNALTLAAAALLVLTTACKEDDAPGKGPSKEEKKKDAIAVKVLPIELRSIAQTYSTSTTLAAEQQATVIARTTGVIRQLRLEEGETVRAGQTLAKLEDDEQTINLARAQLAQDARAREYERQQQLRKQDLTSDVELEQSRSAADDAEQALKLAALEMERTTIRAPFSGVIARRHLDVGASVSSGTAVYDIADVDPLIAEVRIPERHVATLTPGQSARLFADATGAIVEGRILRMAPLVDPDSGTVKVTVAIEGNQTLRPGAFVKVDIITDTHDDTLVVQRSALVAEGRRWHIFTTSEDATTAIKQPVTLGYEEGASVEILPPEALEGEESEVRPFVTEGANVVVVGAPALTDGAELTVFSEAGKAEPAPTTDNEETNKEANP